MSIARTIAQAIILSLVILWPVSVHSDAAGMIDKTVDAIMKTSHLERISLHAGLPITLCLAQSARGFGEGYHFRQSPTYLINESNYHAFETFQTGAYIASGCFLWATVREDTIPTRTKISRTAGSIVLSRQFMEWSYKYARYGNPFDYSPEHNKHALVYFTISDGKIIDAYLGVNERTGPIVDVALTALGLWLLRK